MQAVKDIEANSDISDIIIGIGSSQYSDTKENPFSYEARKEMVNKVMAKEIKKPYKIFSVPDIHNDEKWVAHVTECLPEFDVVYSGNDWVIDLFRKANFPVLPVEFKINISATNLRKMIAAGDKKWQQYICKEIIEDITK